MISLKEYLKKVIQKLTGNVLVIGLRDSSLLDMIDENKKIQNCYLLNTSEEKEERKKRFSLRREKTISIKKFRKTFKKKRIDTIICNIKDMEDYLQYFVRDSIYICRGKVYFFGKIREIEKANLKQWYERYQVLIKEEKWKDGKVFVIEVGNAKTHWYKELWYRITTVVTNVMNLMSDYLTN